MSNNLLQGALDRMLRNQQLTRTEARTLLQQVFEEGDHDDAARDIAVAALLTALAMKGETVEEIVGFAQAMRAAAADIGLNGTEPSWVDTCGTGGRGLNILNISTAAAFTVAGAGVPVAKHGNRSNSNACGAADVLEAAGVNLEFPAERLGPCLHEIGIAFLFAPLLHPAMRRVRSVRRALGMRTVFNLLGPLTNPAGARAQVVGVPQAGLVVKMAEALLALGTDHSFVAYAHDGTGELTTTALNDVAEIHRGTISYYTLDARELGLRRAMLEELKCEGPAAALAALHRVLEGKPGADHDVVSLNAGAALVAAGKASDLRHGITLARESLAAGAAAEKLAALIEHTRGEGARAQIRR
ncbi:MAG: anthranilate phosphoribosyltransferase [Terriglobales bacterium]